MQIADPYYLAAELYCISQKCVVLKIIHSPCHNAFRPDKCQLKANVYVPRFFKLLFISDIGMGVCLTLRTFT